MEGKYTIYIPGWPEDKGCLGLEKASIDFTEWFRIKVHDELECFVAQQSLESQLLDMLLTTSRNTASNSSIQCLNPAMCQLYFKFQKHTITIY